MLEEEEPWKLVAAIAANSRKKAPREVRLTNENDRVTFADIRVEKNVILWENNSRKEDRYEESSDRIRVVTSQYNLFREMMRCLDLYCFFDIL